MDYPCGRGDSLSRRLRGGLPSWIDYHCGLRDTLRCNQLWSGRSNIGHGLELAALYEVVEEIGVGFQLDVSHAV